MTASHACPTCGHEHRLGAKFCQKCGAHLDSPPVTPIDQKNGTAPARAGSSMYQPTLPLPARAPGPTTGKPVSPLTGRAKTAAAAPMGSPPPTGAGGEIAKTLMLKGAALPSPAAPATDYQLGPPLPARAAWPAWLWFLLGLLAGILLAVAVLQYGPELLRLFR